MTSNQERQFRIITEPNSFFITIILVIYGDKSDGMFDLKFKKVKTHAALNGVV